jgi:hypothetical protein
MTPDEDEPEDPRRKCERCNIRPRWSCYPLCRYCSTCGRPDKHIKRRAFGATGRAIRAGVRERAPYRI